MVRLRSKLHLSRQGRKSPSPPASCPGPGKCNLNASVPTRPAGSPSETGPAELPTSSFPGSAPGARQTSGAPGLTALPEELLLGVAAFCNFSDILRLRRSCKALHRILDKSLVIEEILSRLVSLLLRAQHPTFPPPPAHAPVPRAQRAPRVPRVQRAPCAPRAPRAPYNTSPLHIRMGKSWGTLDLEPFV